LQSYQGDHVDLLVRYMFTLTADEQRMLLGRSPSAANAPPRTNGASRPGAK
jgi:hypothetical protein